MSDDNDDNDGSARDSILDCEHREETEASVSFENFDGREEMAFRFPCADNSHTHRIGVSPEGITLSREFTGETIFEAADCPKGAAMVGGGSRKYSANYETLDWDN